MTRHDNSKRRFFWFSVVSRGIELFHLSNLIQMSNDRRLVDIEFCSNFGRWKRIEFDNCSQPVVINFRWLATRFLIFKALISFAKLLEPSLHWTVVGSSRTKCYIDIASCLRCFTHTFWTHKRELLQFLATLLQPKEYIKQPVSTQSLLKKHKTHWSDT